MGQDLLERPGNDARTGAVPVLISTLLRVGVLTSVSLVLLGTVLTFTAHPSYLTSSHSLHHLKNEPEWFPHTIPDIMHGVASANGPAIVMLGLVVLAATPVLRVAVSTLVFVIERDRAFVAITFFVLLMLLASFALGKASG